MNLKGIPEILTQHSKEKAHQVLFHLVSKPKLSAAAFNMQVLRHQFLEFRISNPELGFG